MIDKISYLRENTFQQFCGVLLSLHDPAFQAVDGSGGDMGNDGFRVAGDTMFQAYAPERKTKHKVSSKINKSVDQAAQLRQTSFPSLTRFVLLTPFDLTHEVHEHLRAAVRRHGLVAESWGETKLAALLAKHPEARTAFAELLLPDLAGELRALRGIVQRGPTVAPTFRRLMFEDVATLVNKIVWFWQDAYQQAVPVERPHSVAELLSEKYLNLLAIFLDMDAGPMVVPRRTWWDALDRHFVDTTEAANTILQRHGTNLDVDAYELVSKILREYLNPNGHLGVITAHRDSDDAEGIPRPRNLLSYWRPSQWLFAPIVDLYLWCVKKHEELTRAGLTNLCGVVNGPQGGVGPANPPSMINPSVRAEQLARYQEWARQNSFVVGRDPIEWRQIVRVEPK